MNSGPLGLLPRLTSASPLVNRQSSSKPVPVDLTTRPHSYRGYEPEEFMNLLEEGVSKSDLRTELKVIESRRFYDMLKETYDFWVPLDLDEKELFYSRSKHIVEWLEVYATLEDLRRPSEDVPVSV